MNKLFKFFLTSAAISAALVGVVSCQKDFAPDIESLNKKVAELTQKLSDLQSKIDAGEVVTAVTPTAGGITVTTNKGTYNITNGTNGADGKDGANGKDGADGKDGKDGVDGKDGKDGSVVTIGDNGNWFIDGVDTGLAAAGKDGKDGKDGVDGKDGKDGENGKDGKDGENGKDGKDGQNGEYYVPNTETGFFTKYTWDATKGEYVATETTISFLKPGAITAVWDKENNQLVFKGIEGKDPYTISLLAEVKSLVFMPTTYIDGVEALVFDNFTYLPQVIKAGTIDSKREYAVADSTEALDDKGKVIEGQFVPVDSIPVQPAILAQYHVNPTNADLSFLKEGTSDFLSFVVVENAKKIETRAKASKDFAVTPVFKSFEKGVLTVEVLVTGTPATEDLLSVIALNVEKASGEFVTSDYATLQKQDLDQLVIAFKNSWAKDNLAVVGEKKDAHFRRAAEPQGISVVDPLAYIDTIPAWTEEDMTLDQARATCDVAVKFDGSIDLKEIVAAHTVVAQGNDSELVDADLERLGLTWAFEVVKNYRIGTEIDPSLTDQADFVNLEDGVFTPKVFGTSGIAAVGRTPIIRVALKRGDDVVSYAYIKVFISNKEETTDPFDAIYEFDDTFGFACAQDDSLLTTVEYMNVNIYNEIGLPAKDFHALYNAFDAAYMGAKIPNPKKPSELIDPWVNVGTVEDIVNSESQGTHILKWKISADEAWANAGKEIVHYVAYYNDPTTELKAIIKLVAKVDPFQKEYNVALADYISNYWNTDKTATRYNVAVPQSSLDTDPVAHDSTLCIFLNDINASFEHWRTDDVDDKGELINPSLGLIKISPVVTKVDYFFCGNKNHGINAPKIDGKAVEFKIVTDTVLTAKLAGATVYDTIAVINNHPDTLVNTITLNKQSDLAKALLNTKQLYVNIGAKGYVCDDPGKIVKITFNGEDHFRADYVRPINITDTATDKFIDGVSKGEVGSFIRIEDIISPSDWRQELDSKKWIAGEYGHNRQFANYPSFWDYYGTFVVEIDKDHAKCNTNGYKHALDQGMNIEIMSLEDLKKIVTTDVAKKLKETKYGYVVYWNRGLEVQTSYNLYLNATIKYGWGVIEVEDIVVPVAVTIEG